MTDLSHAFHSLQFTAGRSSFQLPSKYDRYGKHVRHNSNINNNNDNNNNNNNNNDNNNIAIILCILKIFSLKFSCRKHFALIK